ncbi:contactin-associated protein-like 2 isoform X2 [Daphnia pulicaria]|uniref:contactin-associated protein-like 2 isoform X2 n=1 Tax=Daphnia pulicaria TaxID=35523 RepID=UPI001EECCABB|nr:contactin-associated protein-like 2 isoform X2 [Daphnia pulicaria]
MAKSYHTETLIVFFCAFLLSVTSGQHPNLLLQTKDDTINLRLEYETLKTRFEEFAGAVEIQFDRLREEVRQLKTNKASEKNSHTSVTSRGVIPRSCHEARLADPSLSTGVYWIDPDGQGVGDDPIQVNCDMSSGTTIIGHNTEVATNVSHCTEPGCYTRPIVYEASPKQITALTKISVDCRQSIKYECYSAPLQFDGIEYSWWNDRNGNEQYYWHGNDNSTHMCSCGIAKMCVDPSKNCNCDAIVPVDLVDEGEITAKESLPITRLNFGRTIPAASSGIHTLGKLKCSGQKLVDGMPTSCVELWQIGHVLNGLYLIKGASQVETVYCDFSKASTDAGFETWIGFADVKSSSVYFDVQRNTTFSTINSVIPYEITRTNVGNAMNPSTGIFIAPRPGKYFFDYSGIADVTQGTNAARVDFQLNGARIAQGYSHTTYDAFAHQSTLELKEGDQIRLFLVAGAINGYHTTFIGWLVEEDDGFNVIE